MLVLLVPTVEKGIAWTGIETAHAFVFRQKGDIRDAANVDDHSIFFIRAEDVLVKSGHKRGALSAEGDIGRPEIRDRGNTCSGRNDRASA